MNPENHSAISQTQIRRIEQYRDRWSSYGASTGILDISEKLSAKELREYEIFQDYDDAFLEKISADIAIVKWQRDSILFEEGSYLDLAFFIIQGTVDVYLSADEKRSASHPIFDVQRTGTFNLADLHQDRQSEGLPETSVYQTQIEKQDKKKSDLVFLSVMDFNLGIGNQQQLGSGEIIGEIGALSGWPQSVTARTATDCELVQIRVPALRLMKRKSNALKDRIDTIYRERALFAQVKGTPLFQSCHDQVIDYITQRVELISLEPAEELTVQGEPANAVFLVRSGFVKLSQKLGEEQIVFSYLSKGMTLGEESLLVDGMETWQHTATSVEYAEVVKLPIEDFKKIIRTYPDIEERLWESLIARVKEAGYAKKNITQSEFTDTALSSGLAQGNSILVVDLDICTRCDDCVRGCSETHGGLPRFIREGNRIENFLVNRACYHCRDPVCLVGCPTGAIHRTNIGDVVAIDEQLCIGCQSCANNCPYDAITMFETGKVWPNDMVPQGLRGLDQKLATKCDLCYQSQTGPACVHNCPQACAFRISSLTEFQELLPTTFESVDSRKNGKKTKGDSWIQSPKWFTAFSVGFILCLLAYFLNVVLTEVHPYSVWGITYGSLALGFLIGATSYGIRRRVVRFTKKFGIGKKHSWLQFHMYGGTLFLLLVLMHSGFRVPTGSLTWWLWFSSIWVTVSGLIGVLLQKWIPKILTSGISTEINYARIPQLIQEIRDQAESLVQSCGDLVNDFYKKNLAFSLTGPQLRLIYYIDITGGIQSRTKQLNYLRRFLSGEEKEKLAQLENMYKTKLEIDAHYTLQKALRWWLYLHLPVSIVLVILVALHLFTILYY